MNTSSSEQNCLIDYLGQPDSTRYFRLGRHALVAALVAINLPKKSKVLVPAFICRDLLAAIHATGYMPVFYEVDPQLNPVAFAEDAGIGVVLAVNYFGFPQDMDLFTGYCQRIGAVLIEDNAHGFLSEDAYGVRLGLRGDWGIFSMRKTLLLPGGAALVANSPNAVVRIPEQLPFEKQSLPWGFRIKVGLSALQRSWGLNVLAWGQDAVRLVRWVRTGHSIAPLPAENEFTMPGLASPHPHLLRQSRIKFDDERRRRRELFEFFRERLTNLAIKAVFPKLPDGVAPYGYPFYADDATAERVVKIARKCGLDCVRWPDLPTAVAPTAPSHYRTLWMINFLC